MSRRTSLPGWAIALVLLLGLVPALVFLFLAAFAVCGISGCSGAGFGRSTAPGTTLILLGLAGAGAGGPLFVAGVVSRDARMVTGAAVAAIVVSVGGGLAIGATWNGCPRVEASCTSEPAPALPPGAVVPPLSGEDGTRASSPSQEAPDGRCRGTERTCHAVLYA